MFDVNKACDMICLCVIAEPLSDAKRQVLQLLECSAAEWRFYSGEWHLKTYFLWPYGCTSEINAAILAAPLL